MRGSYVSFLATNYMGRQKVLGGLMKYCMRGAGKGNVY